MGDEKPPNAELCLHRRLTLQEFGLLQHLCILSKSSWVTKIKKLYPSGCQEGALHKLMGERERKSMSKGRGSHSGRQSARLCCGKGHKPHDSVSPVIDIKEFESFCFLDCVVLQLLWQPQNHKCSANFLRGPARSLGF